MQVKRQLPALALVTADDITDKGAQLVALKIGLLVQLCIVQRYAALGSKVAEQHAALLVIQAQVIRIDLNGADTASAEDDR